MKLFKKSMLTVQNELIGKDERALLANLKKKSVHGHKYIRDAKSEYSVISS